MTTHSSSLDWKIPWTAERSGLQSMGSQRVGHDGACTQLEQLSVWDDIQCYCVCLCVCACVHVHVCVCLSMALIMEICGTVPLTPAPFPFPF